MAEKFRKLGHCREEESDRLRGLKIGINVLGFMMELAMKYKNEDQVFICRMELERLKKEFDDTVHEIFKRTGKYPSRSGKVEILQTGDVMEYFQVVSNEDPD